MQQLPLGALCCSSLLQRGAFPKPAKCKCRHHSQPQHVADCEAEHGVDRLFGGIDPDPGPVGGSIIAGGEDGMMNGALPVGKCRTVLNNDSVPCRTFEHNGFLKGLLKNDGFDSIAFLCEMPHGLGRVR